MDRKAPPARDEGADPVETSKTESVALDTIDSGIPDPETPGELVARAKRYARRVPIDVDPDRIEWEVSHRAKRRAGACLFHPESERITIRLTWDAYEAFGWERFTGTIRHELVHALEYRERGESAHGEFFDRWATRLDAPRHCPRFTRPNYWIRCTECENRSARYRRSTVVEDPDRYSCGSCGGRLTVDVVDGADDPGDA